MKLHEDFNELASLVESPFGDNYSKRNPLEPEYMSKPHLKLLREARTGKLKEDPSWDKRLKRAFKVLKASGYITAKGSVYMLSTSGKKALAGWEKGPSF